MDRCPSCDAERESADSPCAKCGAPFSPGLSLELEVRPRPAPAARPVITEDLEPSFDLAFDPRDREPSDARPQDAIVRVSPADERRLGHADAAHHDASDAWLLADYGEPPRHWVVSPLYALRVLKRRRAIKRALAQRTEEAERAKATVEDAMVAMAERIRPAAEGAVAYADAFEALGLAERILRSRDQVLASEHDAQAARLASIDARLAKLESELAEARADGRQTATTLVSLQGVLAREESNLKRAEAELRSSQTRLPRGTRE